MRLLVCLLLQGILCSYLIGAEPQGAKSGSLRRLAPVESAGEIELDRLMGFENSEDGTLFQLTRLHANGAKAVKVRLTNVRLPEGALLFVYGIGESGDAERIQGPFSGTGPTTSGEFWTLAVRGEDVVVEVQVAGEALPSLPYDIAEVSPVDVAEVDATEGVSTIQSTATRKGIASYRGFNVEYEVKEGQAVIEGDIEIGPEETVEQAPAGSKSRESIAITSTTYRWPSGIMPYTIDPAMTDTYRITDAVNHWNTMLAGVIRIVPRTNESVYATFRVPPSAGTCSSSVGRIGIAGQSINIGAYCGTGNTIHEIGHALGLYHEQSREDRDRFVAIQWANITSTATNNFNQANSTASDVGAYDYNSIMHYGAYSFSANGLPTILTIPEGIYIGQRSGLSAGDIAGIRAIYPSSTTTTPPPPPPPTTPPPTTQTMTVTLTSNPVGAKLSVDGASVTAPFTATWAVGSSHNISGPANYTVARKKMRFVNWSNGGARSQTVTANSTVTMYVANYSSEYQLRADPAIQGTGTVTVSPASADGYYPENSTVGLMATPAAGYCFTGWTGLLPGTPSQTSLVMTDSFTAIANFTQGGSLQGPSRSVVAQAAGGQYKVGTLPANGCPMTASSTVPWVTTSFQGKNAMITVAPLTGGPANRVGTVTFGNQTVVVYQFSR